LVRFLNERLGLGAAEWTRLRQTGESLVDNSPAVALDAAHVQKLRAIVGPENASTNDFSRLRYACGQSAEEILQLRAGSPAAASALVLHPRHADDIRAIVTYCHGHHIPITPFGGGTSVTLGVCPAKGGVTLAMRTHMHRVLEFNEANQTITVEPGMLGPDYEACLNQAQQGFKAHHRYTGGHFPQSFEFSTVGGWIAALGAGQQSSYYGDMYDLVLGQTYVTPVGDIVTGGYAATATGPKVNDMMKGSEGVFGVLTSATLRIFRSTPGNRRRFGFLLPGWQEAVAAAREISQGEFGLPSMMRISDAEETEAAVQIYGLNHPWVEKFFRLRGLLPAQRCLLLGQSDGEKHFSRNVARLSKRICRGMGGLWLSGYPAARWDHGRFLDPYMRDDLFDMGILIDTLETAVTWDRLAAVHAGVREFITARPRTLCLSHASHFYPQGTNLYFIFITPMMAVEEYRRFQKAIITKILECGGSLSHHHGVGKTMGPFMQRHIGPQQMAVLRALKRHFDPHGIMNPGGTLGLDLADKIRHY
jgi:alkyldihydroxyacetonephosphate synthase